MHPVIRLAGFVLLCVLRARAAWAQVFTAAALLWLSGTPLARIAQRASLLLENVLQRAESAPCVTLEIPACGAPPLRQWVYLLLAGTLFWALGTP